VPPWEGYIVEPKGAEFISNNHEQLPTDIHTYVCISSIANSIALLIFSFNFRFLSAFMACLKQ